jgi:omega-6 fatty acid desaturase (delta-12 desaturase)
MTFVALTPTAGPSEAVLQDIAALAAKRRSLHEGLTVFGVHFALYLATLVGAVAPLPLWLNLVFAAANGVFIALLFIIGHDAGHGSLVPGRNWNLWLSRISFLPCVHAASLWRVTHNKRHHARTNLKGVDAVWAPMGVQEYKNSHPARCFLERIYRGPAGPLIYYYGEFWIHRVLLPLAPEVRRDWKRHAPDSAFALAGFYLTLSAIALAGNLFAPERPLWLVLLVGWAMPFAIWNYLMAFTIYLNHTHPSIPWFCDEMSWKAQRMVQGDTASVIMPITIAPLYTKVMAHSVHHMQPGVPVYALPQAEGLLKTGYSGMVEYMLTLGAYRSIYKTCKLFDFERMCWTDFNGVPTAWPLQQSAEPVTTLTVTASQA